MSTHLLDQGVFRPTLPEDIDWEPFPAFRVGPSRRRRGQPAEPAPYVVRVKLPSGVKLMPHSTRGSVYTVMSGVFYIGLGEQFDDGKLQAYPPGAVIVLPAVPSFPLGQIRRVRYPGDGDRADQPRIPRPGRRPRSK